MAANLTVILGAGTAVDVVEADSNQVSNARLRPPVTADLFTTHRDLEPDYISYPGVETVLQELRNAIGTSTPTSSLEEYLKSLRDSPDAHRRWQFRHFPLYLQHFFSRVSWEYCMMPSNYYTLLNKTLTQQFGRVVYVTLNYDLLFDRALEKHNSTIFQLANPDLSKYVAQDKWKYVKLHGSIDWGRRIKKAKITNDGKILSALIDNIDKIGDFLNESLEEDIIIDPTYNQGEREPVYPAISVPTGESKLNCPAEQVGAIKDHLNNCLHYLIIGYSGFDTDILEVLDKKEGGFGKVLIVSSSEEKADAARSRIMGFGELSGKLQMHIDVYSGKGFNEFIKDRRGLDGFLSTLT